MAGGENEKSLEQTPMWAVASVCAVFLVSSLLVERGIFSLGRYLRRNKQNELFHTLEVIRNELMLLGFVSLLLTVFQPKIASLCMPERLNHSMLPCTYKPPAPPPAPAPAAPSSPPTRRLLAQVEPTKCPPGRVQVISSGGLHELHILIFVLAVVHVLYSCVTVLLGLWQVHSWKRWEAEAREENHDHTVDDALGKHTHKKASSNFVENRVKFSFLKGTLAGFNIGSYVYCFFRQFGRPIYKHDYLCLRLGFIAEHNLTPAFDYHSYIRRTMEEDFKVVVGIRWYLWAFVCIFLLINIHGWYTYFWIAFIPTLTVLFVGTKLQQIITALAIEVMEGLEEKSLRRREAKPERSASRGSSGNDSEARLEKLEKTHPIKPRDELYWLNRPRLLLYLVHFLLFQNAFEFAYFFWGLVTYGFSSCLVGVRWMIIARLLMGVLVQILCSVSTLPLYALVSQLGSHIRLDAALPEVAVSGLRNWRDKAKAKHKARERGDDPDLPNTSEHHDPDHSINIELPRTSGHHGNGETVNVEISNGFHHPPPTTISPPTSPGSADAYNVEIQEERLVAK